MHLATASRHASRKPNRSFGRRPHCRWAGCALVVAVLSCNTPDSKGSILPRTQAALLSERFVAGRLVKQEPGSCQLVDSAMLVPRCGVRPPARSAERLAKIVGELSRGAESDTSPQTLRARALVDLRSAHGWPPALDRAVASLERARKSSPDDAELLNDLAVVHLEIAGRDQRLAPMLEALDAIERAALRDSTSLVVRFNRALILERLYLVAKAREAWSSYLAVETHEAWRAEATDHQQRLARLADSGRAAQDPQQAREAFFRLLGDWGRAAQNRDSLRADSLLRVARLVGDSLRRLEPDGTVSVTAKWMTAVAQGRKPPEGLGTSLVDFAAGVSLNRQAAYERANAVLERAETHLRRLGFPAVHWVAYSHASAEANSNNYPDAAARLRTILREATPDQPAVRGKALRLLGVIELRTGNYESADSLYQLAHAPLAQAKDKQNEAGISGLRTEALALAGRASASMNEALVALQGLAPFRTIYLSLHLTAVAAFAREASLPYAALSIADEALEVNAAVERFDGLASVLCTRARDFASLGDSAQARAALQKADSIAKNHLEGSSQRFALADIDFERGRLWRLGVSDSATVRLARAADSYRELRRLLYVVPALYEGAMVAKRDGADALARTRLQQALALIERQRESFTSAASRSAFYETAERVFDAMIELELDAGKPYEAFQYLERARTALLAPTRRAETTAGVSRLSISDVARTLSGKTLFITYAVLPNRMVMWWTSSRERGTQSIAVPRDSLSAMVGRLSNTASARSNDEARKRLFSLLLGPVAAKLEQGTQLVIAPDRELSEISFATLRDPATGKYVLETSALRTVPSGQFVVATTRLARPVHAASALVVGDPATSGAGPNPLARLRGAKVEANRVATIYPGSLLLTDTAAKRKQVTAAMPAHSVFHFAGHAVFNRDQPERSYLALAHDGTDGAETLQAREIATMGLSKVQLVVLSACATQKSRASRFGAVAGIAYSFLHAGVPRTISTLWDIADESVVELLVDLHTNIARGVEPRDALRQAQLAALRSDRADLQSPAVWGAFIYTGP